MDFMDSNDEQSNILEKVEKFENMLTSSGNEYFDREDFQELIDYYLSINEQDRANTVLSYAFEQHPNSSDLLIAKTHVLIANDQYKEALETIIEIETTQPQNGEVLMAKGTIYSRLKMSEKAINCFKKSLKLAEFKEDVYFLIAMEHQHNMDYEKAIQYHTYALRENSLFELSLYETNVCFDCLGKYEKAIAFYNDFLNLNPYSETAWFNLGAMYAKIDDYKNAVNAYDYALAINPYFSSALFNKGNALASDDRYEEAILTYKETFEHESPSYVTYCYIGECHERLKRYNKALKYYNKAIKEDDTYADAWLGKAIALDHLGHPLDAYRNIKHAIELNDSEPDYWYTAAELEEKLGLTQESIKSMQTAVSLDKSDLNLTVNYIQLIARNLDFKATSEVIDEAMDTFPNNESLMVMKAGYAFKNNLTEVGCQFLGQALSINPKVYKFLFEHFPECKTNQYALELIDQNS